MYFEYKNTLSVTFQFYTYVEDHLKKSRPKFGMAPYHGSSQPRFRKVRIFRLNEALQARPDKIETDLTDEESFGSAKRQFFYEIGRLYEMSLSCR